MKSFLIKILLFSTPVTVSYITLSLFIIPKLIEKAEGPSTASQINNSFKKSLFNNYDLLILGNSGTYRGLNPDMFEIKAYNFSHDHDSYNQLYYKIKFLEKNNKKPKYIILGLDYFQFSFIGDTRNYIYSGLFADEYQNDYRNNAIDLFLDKTNLLDFDRISYLKCLFKKNQVVNFQKENGQFIQPGVAKADDGNFYSIKRLPIQEQYFKKILMFCEANDILVFITMLPARKNILKNYTEKEIADFNSFINKNINNKTFFLDYSHQKGWSLEDYTDIIHLSPKAADRFSKQLNDTIINIIKNINVKHSHEGGKYPA